VCVFARHNWHATPSLSFQHEFFVVLHANIKDNQRKCSEDAPYHGQSACDAIANNLNLKRAVKRSQDDKDIFVRDTSDLLLLCKNQNLLSFSVVPEPWPCTAKPSMG